MPLEQENDYLSGVELCCERGGRQLFKELSFQINSGEALIIRGSNGSGKTSLLRIITGLGQAACGEVRWNNEKIDNIAEQYQSELLYVGHLSAVKAELTVRENLQLLLKFWPDGKISSISELAGLIGLGKKLNVPCSRLSAGQIRRVSLARLFIAAQKLWILDEPLTALDVDFIQVIESYLQNHLKKGGIAILTTHRGIELGDQKSITLDL